MESVIKRSAYEQDDEAQNLQAMELLPAQSQTHHPDDQRTQAVQHHSRRGADLLGDADASKIKERNAYCVAQQCQQNARLMANLAESVQRVFQNVPRVAAKAAHRDVEHRDEEEGQNYKPKKTWEKKKDYFIEETA